MNAGIPSAGICGMVLIMEASSTTNSVSTCILASRLKSPSSFFWRYILRCMVVAGSEQLRDNTLAARPVGAISTTLCLKDTNVLTIAATSDVLPVPAEPRNIIAGIP